MSAPASYNQAVRRYFTDPAHAGDLQGAYEQMFSVDVSESDGGPQILLAAGIDQGNIAGMAFRAWGCPHLIAALELACTTLVGQPVRSLERFDSADITQELAVPTEKTGRILLLEDALTRLRLRIVGSEN